MKTKSFLIAIGYILFFGISFGFLCPYLLSADSDILVILGVMLIIINIFVFLKLLIKIFKLMKMKNWFSTMLLLVALIPLITSCSKVPAGYVGVKVYLLGGDKGVDNVVLGVGRYWVGVNQELYTFPTYQINYVYTQSATEGSPENEEFTFQTKEGMECSVDLGLAMRFEKESIAKMFQTYRKGEEEIRGVVVRNTIRDALNKIAGSMNVEYAYGEGKAKLIDSVFKLTKTTLSSTGICIEKLYLIGSIRIPKSVKAALDSKVEATQLAQKAENEVRKAEADAKIAMAKAQGVAQAILIEATAQAEANKKLGASIGQILVNYKAIEKWDGKLPQVSGGNTPFINIKQ